MDHKRCLEIQRPYLGPVVGVYSDWTPLDSVGSLFETALDRKDPWQFQKFWCPDLSLRPAAGANPAAANCGKLAGMTPIRALLALTAAFWLSGSVALAEPRHGIAMHGDPALPADFQHLPYANPDAPQGGQLRQAVTGSFDSVNPFIVKGTSATGVRTYVFESLLGRNWAEPFSLYGLLAESIDVSEDRQTFTFKLRPEAKFSDGSPVTAADVVFSMETLRDKGRPNFKNSYSKISKIETPDERTLVFHQEAGDRELPLIIGVMPIISKAYWQGRAFDETTLDPIVGSGPYVIGEVKPGEAISYRKNPTTGQGPRPVQGPVEFRRGSLRLLPRFKRRLRGVQDRPRRYPHRERSHPLGHGL